MANVVELVEQGLYAKLSGGTALITALGGTAIHNGLAPLNTTPPYVVFQHQGGGDQNLTPSRQRDVVYTVKAIARTQAEAAAIDDAVDDLLHHQTLTVTGWVNFWTAREQDLVLVDRTQTGEMEWQQGGQYRIRLSESES